MFESEQEAAQSHINDTSQTLDMLHPTGVAVLPPTQGSPQATVGLARREILDMLSSTSQGIQEAVDFASSIGTDVAVYGWVLQNLNILCNGSDAAATFRLRFLRRHILLHSFPRRPPRRAETRR